MKRIQKLLVFDASDAGGAAGVQSFLLAGDTAMSPAGVVAASAMRSDLLVSSSAPPRRMVTPAGSASTAQGDDAEVPKANPLPWLLQNGWSFVALSLWPPSQTVHRGVIILEKIVED